MRLRLEVPFFGFLILAMVSPGVTLGGQGHLVVLDQRLKELVDLPCFKAWVEQMNQTQNLQVQVQFEDPAPQSGSVAASVRQRILKSGATEVTVIGNSFWSRMDFVSSMEVEFDSRGRRNAVRKKIQTTSILPWMNPQSPKPESWTDPKAVEAFFSGMNVNVGVIPPVEPRFDGKTPVEQVCSYLKKVVEFKACPKSKSKEPSFIYYVEDDWQKEEQQKGVQTFYSSPSLSPHRAYTLLDLVEKASAKKIGEASWDLCQVSAHGNPSAISDYINSRSILYSLTPEEVLRHDPNVRFFNLFSCSVAAPLASGKANVAQGLLFGSPKTVGLVGSMKSGAVVYPERFYKYFKKDGRSIGESTRLYLKDVLGHSTALENDLGFHAGVVVLGDPTLRLRGCP